MKQRLILLFGVLILIVSLKFGVDLFSYSSAFSYYGSKGSEVSTIQTKLKEWGYYNGAIDSIYGYETYKAVELFQSRNGLSIDGICGQKTLLALGIVDNSKTTNTNNSGNVSRGSVDRNSDLLAHVVNGEARGEPYVGQVAVAAVILNRTKDSHFPHTIAGVVYQSGAFDAVEDGQINLEPSESCKKAARDALNGWDPSYGSIYYYNPETATSKWILTRTIITTIGNHVFAK